MAKRIAIILAVFMVLLALWALFFEHSSTTILINGQEVSGPLKGVIGAGGLVVALIALICLAILLALVYAGTGVIILGFMIVGVMLFAAIMLPFLLPLIIPLALVWAFIVLVRKKG